MKGIKGVVEVERLDAFWLGFRQLLKTHRMEGAVLVLDDGTGRSVTMGWPGCPEECETRNACMAQTLTAAARHLDRAAEKLDEGSAVVRLDEEVDAGQAEKTIQIEKKFLN